MRLTAMLLAGTMVAPSAAAWPEPVVVAARGHEIEGLAGAAVARSIGKMAVAPGGQVAFSAEVTGAGGPSGLLVWEDGVIRPVAIAGDAVAGGPADSVYGSFLMNFVRLAFDGDQLTVRQLIEGPGIARENNIYSFQQQSSGGLEILAGQTSLAPHVGPAARYGTMEGPIGMQGDRALLFSEFVDAPGWAEKRGGISLFTGGAAPTNVAINGQVAPGGKSPEYTFLMSTGTGSTPPQIEVSGEWIAFRSRMTPGGQGIWTFTEEEGLAPVALHSSTTLPGLGPGETVAAQRDVAINASGTVAFRTDLRGGAITERNDAAMVVGPREALQIVAREGDVVPGRPGQVLAPFRGSSSDNNRFQDPLLNDRGHFAFVAEIGDPGRWRGTGWGLFRNIGDGLKALVFNDDPILPGGESLNIVRYLTMNKHGDLAFLDHGGPGVTARAAMVFYGNNLRRVLQVGDVVETSPGVYRKVVDFASSVSGSPAPRPQWAGRTVFFFVEFIDSTEAIVSYTVCRADIDGDDELTIFDFLAFSNLFAAGDLIADFDGDGELTFFDFLAFQAEFAAGCE